MPDHSPRRITADELLEQAGWLRALSLRLARDAASADDLTQGVLVRALGRPPAAGRPLRPWLASVLRSLARRARRGEGRRAERERRAARSEVAPSHSSYLEQFEEQRRLAELVAELEEPYRTVIVRRFFAGESAAKIARETGRPAASVRSQIARGLARLREMHGEAHGGDHLRSLAALGMAAGSGAPFGAPVAGIPSGLAPVLAMKISTKLVTVTVLPILILTGWFGVQMLVGPPHQPELVEAAQPVVLVGDASEGERALTPAPSSGEERTSLSPSVAPGTGTVPQTAPVEPRTTIALRVVDERGKSIAGAVLEFVGESGESAGLAASEPSEHDGRIELDVPREVRFQGFSSDEWLTRLALRASGFATLFFHDSVHDGERTELGDRMMAPGGSIAGRVVTASGMPASDIEIVAMHGSPAQADGSWETAVVFKHDGPRRNEALPRTSTDEFGRFTLMGVPAQPLNLWFHAPDVPWNVSETLTLNAGEHREGVELELPTLGRDDQILGRVLRPDGTPAVGARVRTRLGPFWSGRGLEVDAAGHFMIVPEDDGLVEMMAYDPSETFSPSHRFQARRGGEEVTLVLAPERRLEVLVLGPHGSPLEGSWARPLLGNDDNGQRAQYSDERGRIRLLVPDESFGLRVGASEHVTQSLGPFDPLALPAELVVELESDRFVHGIVVAGGKPVPGASVILMRDIHQMFIAILKGFPEGYSIHSIPVMTDDAGQFRVAVDAIGAESWALLVEKQGYARAEFVLPSSAPEQGYDPIEVELSRGGTLEGRVTVPPSRASAGVVIACSRFDGRPLITRTNAEGFYRLEHLTPGPWRVEDRLHTPRGDMMMMTSRGDLKFEPNVTIDEGGTTVFDINLRWQEDLTLNGRLRFDGVGAQDWTARVKEGQGTFESLDLPPVDLDAEGRFQAPSEPGPMKIVLEAVDGDVTRKIERDVRVDATTLPIELDLATGSLRGSGEESEARLRVSHDLPGGGRFMVLFRADEAGNFEIAGLPAGSVELKRYEDGAHGLGWYRGTEIMVTAGGVTSLE